MKLSILVFVLLVSLGFISSPEATLWDRGGGLIYDNVLNITWLQDANYGAGSSYDDWNTSTDAKMTWDNAVAWAVQLFYAGFNGWRLPDPYNQEIRVKVARCISIEMWGLCVFRGWPISRGIF